MTHKPTAVVRRIIDAVERSGVTSLQGIADALNARGIVTARGRRWYAATVRNIVIRGEQHQAA